MLDLLLNEDETMIVDSLREYLTRELPIERLRPKAPQTDAAKTYAGMVELGFVGIGLPDTVGGSGLGLVEELLVQRECGRYLVTPSLMATVLAAHVAVHAHDDALASHLVGGKMTVALALSAAADAQGDCRVYVFDRQHNQLLLFWNESGMGIFDATAFTEFHVDECLDNSVTMHAGKLSIDKPKYWVSTDAAPLVLQAQVLLAGALIGLAEHATDLAVAYAKVREQYGKPIGTFQAIKHRCADMVVRARLGWYQAGLAALKVQAGTQDALEQAAAAKLVAAQAAHENSRAGIQIHGGIGFQAECDAHWFMKRAHVYDQAGGSIQYQARRIATGRY